MSLHSLRHHSPLLIVSLTSEAAWPQSNAYLLWCCAIFLLYFMSWLVGRPPPKVHHQKLGHWLNVEN